MSTFLTDQLSKQNPQEYSVPPVASVHHDKERGQYREDCNNPHRAREKPPGRLLSGTLGKRLNQGLSAGVFRFILTMFQ